ncbi:hypothetical protein FGG08_000157 [Glutinoglossum americanum]|uniref:Ribose-5-phosphate isomerase n=1 Tax=Glutinoglossum americanum TaxID=1670608 RepID=A0A9P8L690_9PEZI|nr:hypothetical protein FGG08_000157 [Glutinoglossum americanum]
MPQAAPAAQPFLSPHPPPPKTPLTPLQAAKRAAAYHAVSDHLLPNHTYVGIGSGSTIVYVVEAISTLPRSLTSHMTFLTTGHQSRALIYDAGLRYTNIDTLPLDGAGAVRMLDVAFDGADEVDAELNVIKGGGACLFQEKLVVVSAKKFVCVADHRKLSPSLLTSFPSIPVEILPLSTQHVLASLRLLGSPSPTLRSGLPAKAGPVITDNAGFIVDAPFPPLLPSQEPSDEGSRHDVATLAKRIKEIVGVVEVGLFFGAQKPAVVYFGMDDGGVMVKTLEKTEQRS